MVVIIAGIKSAIPRSLYISLVQMELAKLPMSVIWRQNFRDGVARHEPFGYAHPIPLLMWYCALWTVQAALFGLETNVVEGVEYHLLVAHENGGRFGLHLSS